ncbi:hypothetical protein D3C75_530440 [compost metagenome]
MPVCKTENEDYVKYCKRCGNWLLSDKYPAKKIKRASGGTKVLKALRNVLSIISIAAVILVVGSLVYTKMEEKTSSPVSGAQQPQAGYSRTSPAPIGVELPGQVSQFELLKQSDSANFDVSLKLVQVVRGEEAWNILKASKINTPAEDGKEYMLAQFNIKVLKSKNSDAQFTVSDPYFTAVSAVGKDYDAAIMTVPDSIQTKLYAGAEHTGWAVFKVEPNDSPLIVFARDGQGRGGIWFTTK